MEKIYLILENGATFEGYSVGAKGEVIGEVVFTTGVAGFLDTLTDPSHCGQIVVQTFPVIGSYGVIKESVENKKPFLSGYVVRNICDLPSNFRCEGRLEDYLIDNNIICISGIDTRRITKIIREQGVMNGIITSNPVFLCEEKTKVAEYKVSNVLAKTANDSYVSKVKKAIANVVVVNYGACKSLVQKLNKLNISVEVVAYNTSAKDILAKKADGVVLSNGGGNPADNVNEIAEISKLVKAGVALYATGLGHLMLALAVGGKTYKSKFGHHGANQPVKNTQDNRIYVTSQNHLYDIDEESIKDKSQVYFYNINDKSCEGVIYNTFKAISTQFEPNVCEGPMNASFVFEKFIQLMGGKK